MAKSADMIERVLENIKWARILDNILDQYRLQGRTLKISFALAIVPELGLPELEVLTGMALLGHSTIYTL
jgi:hypothetical protein